MTRRSTFTKSFFSVLGAAALTILLSLNAPAEARRYASIVVDADTGEILSQRYSDRSIYPASLTKMMTLYMLFEEIQRGRFTLNSKLSTSPRAAGQPASKLGLRRGQTITVRQAIQALAVKSANDVATVVAESISGTEWEFARAMTKRARLLGMRSTTFRNASGLPHKSQRTTAHDMAILARALMRDFPQHYKFFSERSFRYRGRTYRTHNRMLGRYKGMDGLKTGYTRSSGYNLAASALRDGRRLIGIVIGGRTSATRNAEMKRLLDAGFRQATLMVNRPASTIVAAAPPLPRANPRRAPVQLASATESDTPFSAQVKAAARASATLAPEFTLSPQPLPATGAAAATPVQLGRWAIQVGAFARRDGAERVAARAQRIAPKLLAGAEPSIERIRSRRGYLYRARLLGLSKQAARAACSALENREMGCLPMVLTKRQQLALARLREAPAQP